MATDQPSVRAGAVRPGTRPGPLRTALLVMGSAGAAAIHFAVVPAHADESTLLAVGFAVVAWLQAAFAVAVLVRPTRTLLLAGALLNTAAIAVWGWSRLFGLPFGIGGGDVEAVEAVDALCALLEVAVVGAAVWPARATSERRHAPAMVAAAGLATLLVVGGTSVVLAAPSAHGHTHADTQAHSAPDDHEAHASAGTHEHQSTASATEGGAAASRHEHAACTAPVTDTQRTAADELVADTRATLRQYTSLDAAVADGFVNVTPEGRRVVHYARPDRLADGNVLDPSAPESLVYAFPASTPPVLLGAMYLMEGRGDPPTPGGCLTQWHRHTNLCLAPGEGMVAVVGSDGTCPVGSRNSVTHTMMHVWRYDTSVGPFAELRQVPVAELRAVVIADLRGR